MPNCSIESLQVIRAGGKGHPRGSCESCGFFLWSDGGYCVPGLKGLYCSLVCIECAIAEKIGNTRKIPGVPIRKGARLLAHLKIEAPELYRKLVGAVENQRPGYCQNPACPNGDDGMPADLESLKAGARYCSDACRMQAHRSPRQKKSGSKTPAFIEFFRNGEQGVRIDA